MKETDEISTNKPIVQHYHFSVYGTHEGNNEEKTLTYDTFSLYLLCASHSDSVLILKDLTLC